MCHLKVPPKCLSNMWQHQFFSSAITLFTRLWVNTLTAIRDAGQRTDGPGDIDSWISRITSRPIRPHDPLHEHLHQALMALASAMAMAQWLMAIASTTYSTGDLYAFPRTTRKNQVNSPRGNTWHQDGATNVNSRFLPGEGGSVRRSWTQHQS